MSRFKQGETSDAVKEKKLMITQSIIRKAKILDKIKSHSDIPSTLICGASGFSQASINKWSDESFGVVSYSYNSARAKHNADALSELLDSIDGANNRLKHARKKVQSISVSDKTKPSRVSVDEVHRLREENEELKVALAEIYRAYMQLLDSCREDEQIDKAYRKLILEQARILGANRVAEVE
ncbi:conserved hypothetical protein [Vibrio crassostreae]|nr:conserved hypothetical protein [Vibrio crassostreae]